MYNPVDCGDCKCVDDLHWLMNSLVEDIQRLECEVVKWRSILCEYLPPSEAVCLKGELYSDLGGRYDCEAYQQYIKACHDNQDPLESKEHIENLKQMQKWKGLMIMER